MNLYLFNPENDLALADFSPHYTPPKNARSLAKSGALLPVWYASEGDITLAHDIDPRILNTIRERFNIEAAICSSAEGLKPEKCKPWGWSPAIVENLANAGVEHTRLPSMDYLNTIRSLSHRRSSIYINRELHKSGIDTPPLPIEINTAEEFQKRYSDISEDIILKSPWSSSGRGIIDSSTMPARQFMRHLEGIIRHQGSVVIERRMAKTVDFAMLFRAMDGDTRFAGYSLFDCDCNGAYTGNLLISDKVIEQELALQGVETETLHIIRANLERILTALIGNKYEGPLGIDMLTYRTEKGNVAVAPCVELNLRNTMGHVAHKLTDRFLGEESMGKLCVVSNNATTDSYTVIDNGRLIEGTIDLSPTDGRFQFLFSAERNRLSSR